MRTGSAGMAKLLEVLSPIKKKEANKGIENADGFFFFTLMCLSGYRRMYPPVMRQEVKFVIVNSKGLFDKRLAEIWVRRLFEA